MGTFNYFLDYVTEPNKLRLLLAEGADARATDDKGRTGLMLAAYAWQLESVEMLLPLSDPMAADDNGNTALMFAAANKEASALKFVELLMPVSDIGAKDKYGQTALHFAAANGNEFILMALAKASDVRAVNANGHSAADLATINGHHGCARRISAILARMDSFELESSVARANFHDGAGKRAMAI